MKSFTIPAKSSLFLSILLLTATMTFAQDPIVIPLWPDGAPNSNGLTGTEEDLEGGRVANVTEPSITVYPAAKPNGMAIVACPGGGYVRLAMNHEGHDLAAWYNAQGITYAVLKYRMPNGHSEVPLSDAGQAIALVRQHAEEWGVDPHKVGIQGASAGGHLAASAATLYTSDDTRPDFQVLFYPVITMQDNTHAGSRAGLLGPNPTDKQKLHYSLESQVNDQTPPAFIMLSTDDRSVPPTNGVNYYLALQAHDVPAALHVYPIGGHGWGFRDSFTYKMQWTQELEKWLRELY